MKGKKGQRHSFVAVVEDLKALARLQGHILSRSVGPAGYYRSRCVACGIVIKARYSPSKRRWLPYLPVPECPVHGYVNCGEGI